MTQKLDLGGLARFLVRAKIESYAGNGREVTSERPGFKELEFAEGDWNYRDSYVGFFMAPGQEIARFQGSPVWAMSYNGGMLPDYRNHVGYAKEVFTFLKKSFICS
ncbi:MAG: hypothetical protein KKC19_00590 [Nanoarchaeota archaeon]|nr:hypothetical protein [Nanoarchaeota archaeon]